MLKGHKHTVESKEKMRKASILNGNRPPSRKGISVKVSEEQKEKIRLSLTGKKHTLERRKNQSEAKKGAKSIWWKGGLPDCKGCGKVLCQRLNKTGLCILCLRKYQVGELSPSWKGGISSDSQHYSREYRAKKKNTEGTHTLFEWQELKKKYNYMCLCCKKQEPEIKLTEDHIVPISKGGSDYISNIQPLCGSCNSRKSNKHIDFISPYNLAEHVS